MQYARTGRGSTFRPHIYMYTIPAFQATIPLESYPCPSHGIWQVLLADVYALLVLVHVLENVTIFNCTSRRSSVLPIEDIPRWGLIRKLTHTCIYARVCDERLV